MTRVSVRAERPYDVVVEAGALRQLPELVGDAEHVAVVHPPTLADRLPDLEQLLGRPVLTVEVPDAEQGKTAQVLETGWHALAHAGFTRSDAVVGFGGGATTDVAGFIAATYLRGVPYVSVPTTVLAMVDAGVGGKTGINLPHGKNLVGAFYEPRGVLCDLELLQTLPGEDVRAGLAEVVKAGFIADPAILDVVEARPDKVIEPESHAFADIVTRAIRVKAGVVSADLREATSVGSAVGRELLNYGHTLGHAIERHERYTWKHGQAISVGMVFAAELSRRAGLLDAGLLERHRTVLELLGLPTRYSHAAAWPQLRAAMNLDKKTRGSVLRFVVLTDLARASMLVAPDEELLRDAFAAVT